MLKNSPLKDFTPLAKAKVNELQIIDIVDGTGDETPQNATITAHYTGALASNGLVFESSHDTGSPATFGLHQVIDGWTQGVPGMKVGGTRRLIIPSALAYGDRRASAEIGPNSDLVFDIELIDIKQ